MSVVPVVHVVSNDEVLLRDDFLPSAQSVMAALGARGAVHLRARWLPARRLHELAAWLQAWERDTGCWAVVNDRLDVAVAAGVRALQLTSRSMSVEDARTLQPDLRIGASVHSPGEAVAAEAARVDWCVAGTAFPSETHPGEATGGLSLMGEIARAVTVPVIAIGGILPAAISDLRNAGVYGVATIRGVWNAADSGEAARRYLSMYEADGSSD